MKQNEFSDQVFDYIFPAMITLEIWDEVKWV